MTQSAPPTPVTHRRSIQAVVACIVGAVALTGLDLWSKSWAESSLSMARSGEAPPICVEENGYIPHQRLRGESIPVTEDIFPLKYAENCGGPEEAHLMAAVVYFILCYSLSWMVKRLHEKIAIIR